MVEESSIDETIRGGATPRSREVNGLWRCRKHECVTERERRTWGYLTNVRCKLTMVEEPAEANPEIPDDGETRLTWGIKRQARIVEELVEFIEIADAPTDANTEPNGAGPGPICRIM